MREVIEFRIPEQQAAQWLGPNQGTKLGDGLRFDVRKVELDATDPRIELIEKADSAARKLDDRFFFSWSIRRYYTAKELSTAELLQLKVTAFFEPAGEQCGTQYDESSSCPVCGAGAKQASDLFLPISRIPKRKDIAQTIARGEIVVSTRLVDLLERNSITGIRFGPVRRSPNSVPAENWHQLVVENNDAEIVPPTRSGNTPFNLDEKDEFRCPIGPLLGLNLLSEVSVKLDVKKNVDVRYSRQFIGVRRGVIRPERILLVSPKVAQLIQANKIRGCRLEVAHLM